MTNKPVSDSVHHPKHYRKDSGFEAIDVIEAWELCFNLGNAVKYISRVGRKDKTKSVEDLQKALWYLEREIKNLQKLSEKEDQS